jgi:hypothetical protein
MDEVVADIVPNTRLAHPQTGLFRFVCKAALPRSWPKGSATRVRMPRSCAFPSGRRPVTGPPLDVSNTTEAMTYPKPLAERAPTDAGDLDLVRLVQLRNTGALELLIGRHQRWVYNSRADGVPPSGCRGRDTGDPPQAHHQAVDLSRGEPVPNLDVPPRGEPPLNVRRGRAEVRMMSFEDYGRELDRTLEADLVAPADSEQPDALLLVEEAKIGCTSAMLLWLDRAAGIRLR